MLFSTKNIESDNYYEQGKYKLAFRLCVLFSSLFLLLALSESFNSVRNTMVYIICAVVPITSLIYLIKTQEYRIVYLIFCSAGTLIAFYTLNFLTQEAHFGDILWMILLIILAYFGLSPKFGILFLVLSLLNLTYYFTFRIGINISSLRELTFIARLSIFIEVAIIFIAISAIIHQFVKFYKYSFEALLENKIILENNNNLISSQNDENIILMKEVHHRVKNNLQIIISLLRLQKHELNEESKEKFEEAINRIMTMSLIHQKLYQTEELSNINLQSYIQELINEIISSLSTLDNVKANINTDIKSMGLKTIVPFGLLINELLSNSFKHAFGDSNNKIVNIDIKSESDSILTLYYSDNGKWKEPNKSSSQFGLELIQVLTDQLDGSFNRENSSYTFTLQNLDN